MRHYYPSFGRNLLPYRSFIHTPDIDDYLITRAEDIVLWRRSILVRLERKILRSKNIMPVNPFFAINEKPSLIGIISLFRLTVLTLHCLF